MLITQTNGPIVAMNTMVKLTKVHGNGLASNNKVGTVLKGRIKNHGALNVGQALELDKGGNTSTITSATKTEDGDYVLTTITGVYFLQKFK
ncbi:hypothetical protein IPF86_04055 [Candidatus Nomurabacteria bacterium]|nr:MAG: hypothetical protein IPF86_04055 [Candidatus Nomurabacteria bacterium]